MMAFRGSDITYHRSVYIPENLAEAFLAEEASIIAIRDMLSDLNWDKCCPDINAKKLKKAKNTCNDTFNFSIQTPCADKNDSNKISKHQINIIEDLPVFLVKVLKLPIEHPIIELVSRTIKSILDGKPNIPRKHSYIDFKTETGAITRLEIPPPEISDIWQAGHYSDHVRILKEGLCVKRLREAIPVIDPEIIGLAHSDLFVAIGKKTLVMHRVPGVALHTVKLMSLESSGSKGWNRPWIATIPGKSESIELDSIDFLIRLFTQVDNLEGVHGDLAPRNIMYDPETGEIKIIDFGRYTPFDEPAFQINEGIFSPLEHKKEAQIKKAQYLLKRAPEITIDCWSSEPKVIGHKAHNVIAILMVVRRLSRTGALNLPGFIVEKINFLYEKQRGFLEGRAEKGNKISIENIYGCPPAEIGKWLIEIVHRLYLTKESLPAELHNKYLFNTDIILNPKQFLNQTLKDIVLNLLLVVQEYGYYPNFALLYFCPGYRRALTVSCILTDLNTKLQNDLSLSDLIDKWNQLKTQLKDIKTQWRCTNPTEGSLMNRVQTVFSDNGLGPLNVIDLLAVNQQRP